MHRHTLVGVLLGAAAALAVPAQASKDVLDRSADPNQWVIQTGDYANQRYSKLEQINRDNVKNLKVAWTFSTGVLRGHEGAPLVVGDVMYVHTPFPNIVYALDLKNEGKIIWKYEPKQDPSVIPVMCCDTVYRGVAYSDGTIYLHQADTTLVALDAATGKEKWKVVNGDPKKGETNTATVLPVKDKVIVGISGAEFGVRGHVTAYEAKTGKQLWRAYSLGPDSETLVRPRKDDVARQAGRQGFFAEDLERRTVEDRRWLRLGMVLLRSGDQPVLLRHRQPLHLEPGAARRTRWQTHRPEMDDVDHRP